MSTYHIITPVCYHEIRESSGIITHASPAIDWSVGLAVDHVLTYSKQKGWQVVPVLDDDEPTVLEHQGITYILHWHHNRLSTILRDDGEKQIEITWQQLPNALKGLI